MESAVLDIQLVIKPPQRFIVGKRTIDILRDWEAEDAEGFCRACLEELGVELKLP